MQAGTNGNGTVPRVVTLPYVVHDPEGLVVGRTYDVSYFDHLGAFVRDRKLSFRGRRASNQPNAVAAKDPSGAVAPYGEHTVVMLDWEGIDLGLGPTLRVSFRMGGFANAREIA